MKAAKIVLFGLICVAAGAAINEYFSHRTNSVDQLGHVEELHHIHETREEMVLVKVQYGFSVDTGTFIYAENRIPFSKVSEEDSK